MNDPSRLEALLESAQLLHSSLDLDDLLRHLLRSVMGRLLVTRGLIAVTGEQGMRLALVRGMAGLHIGDAFDEEAARRAGIDLILPIGAAEEPTGLLGINRPLSGGAIEPDEEKFLSALLGIAASSIENARAHLDTHRLNLSLDQKIGFENAPRSGWRVDSDARTRRRCPPAGADASRAVGRPALRRHRVEGGPPGGRAAEGDRFASARRISKSARRAARGRRGRRPPNRESLQTGACGTAGARPLPTAHRRECLRRGRTRRPPGRPPLHGGGLRIRSRVGRTGRRRL